MMISIIAAMAENRVIGNKNKLPWHLPEDFKRFKDITMGHPVIMGRKTHESMGKLLPGRENIVITRNKNLKIPGATMVCSLQAAFKHCEHHDQVFVLGGAEIFKQALPFTQRLYLTVIHQNFDGDTYFPDINFQNYKVLEKTRHTAEPPNDFEYTFLALEKGSVT